MTPKDVLKMVKDTGAKMIDMRFMDFPGLWQHFSVPSSQLDEGSFEEGFGFDGSSIRGWQPINASDMLVIPVPETAKMDPFFKDPTLVMICNIADPITREPYSRDPRHIAAKAEAYLKSSGIGDTAFIGPEAEFFIFDDIRFDSGRNHAFYEIDSIEGVWNTGRDECPNLGYKPRQKEGYFPVPPMDKFQDLRAEMALTLIDLGIDIEAQHHEVATAGQCEIDMRFKPLLQMADQLQWFKYVLKNVAYRNGHTVTFMPKPLYGDNGSGMHVHQSIWKGGKPLFAGNKYADLSQECLWYIGGILKHAKALNAFTNPSTNSYKRLVPGYEAPVLLAYSARNRSASCRIPHGTSPKSKRIEIRFPDPTANPYLAFAAMCMAGLDGIENKIDPGAPMDKNLYDLPPEELKEIPTVSGSLREALTALEADHDFLLKGGVFSKEQIDGYTELKWEECLRYEMTPHPVEFDMYYSC